MTAATTADIGQSVRAVAEATVQTRSGFAATAAAADIGQSLKAVAAATIPASSGAAGAAAVAVAAVAFGSTLQSSTAAASMDSVAWQ